MSAMVKTRPRTTHPYASPESIEETESGLSRYPDELKTIGVDGEPPEDASRDEEGPESWQDWHTEAPDAGRGDNLSLERDFTHGRSRS